MASAPVTRWSATSSVCLTFQHPQIINLFNSKQTRSGRLTSCAPISCKLYQNADGHKSSIARRSILIGVGVYSAQVVRFENSKEPSESSMAAATSTEVTRISSFPVVLDRAVSAQVMRKNKSRSRKEKDDEEEILVIKGIEFERNLPVKFDVYVNELEGVYGNPEVREFAGSFVNVPHNQKGKKKMKTVLKLGITELLDDLGADDDDSILVTLVPTYGKGEVKIGGIKVDVVKD